MALCTSYTFTLCTPEQKQHNRGKKSKTEHEGRFHVSSIINYKRECCGRERVTLKRKDLVLF
jgi:hypothetical protein